jgi:hypothetical protein
VVFEGKVGRTRSGLTEWCEAPAEGRASLKKNGALGHELSTVVNLVGGPRRARTQLK